MTRVLSCLDVHSVRLSSFYLWSRVLTGSQELGKQAGSMLAPRLKIRGEEYEDLDEIISRRVAACNDLVDDLLASQKVHTP